MRTRFRKHIQVFWLAITLPATAALLASTETSAQRCTSNIHIGCTNEGAVCSLGTGSSGRCKTTHDREGERNCECVERPGDAPTLHIGEANDVATILADSDAFSATYFAESDDQEAAAINAGFTPNTTPDYWGLGGRTSALVQMYDLVAPLDPTRAGRYLARLHRITDALLANRDDARNFPADAFRDRIMPAWGAYTEDRDNRWNTDVVTAGLFTYAMAAFARRVADNPTLHAEYGTDAIRFVTAAIDTYEAFRPELHLVKRDAQAYFTLPRRYASLRCNGNHACEGYRAGAGKPLAYNENLSMMKALAEAALASDSALYRSGPDATPTRLRRATEEAPLLIAKNFTFFDKHLRSKTLSDRTPYFEWDHQQPEPRRIQDIAHASFELGSLAVVLEDQIRLNALLARTGRRERVALSTPLFVRFANTFLRKIWQYDFRNPHGLRNTLAWKVDGTGDRSGKGNIECAGWIPLAQFNRWVWIRCRDATFHPPGYLRVDNAAALLRYRQFL
jgi:hypothetical protein